MKKIGYFKRYGQKITTYFLTLKKLEDWPKNLRINSRYFALFIYHNKPITVSLPVTAKVIRKMIDQGLAAVNLAGRSASKLDLIFDQEIVQYSLDTSNEQLLSIVNNYYRGNPLNESLWCFINASAIAEEFEKECKSWLLVIVGEDAFAKKIKSKAQNLITSP